MSNVQLRPLGFGEILDAAFTIYRRSFVTFFLTALLPSLPALVFSLMFPAIAYRGAETLALEVSWLIIVYSYLASSVTWAGLIHLVGRAVQSEGLSIGAAYRHGLRRLLPFIVGLLLVTAMVGAGIVLLIVPGILLAIMCFAVLSVIVIEGRGPIRAIGRSRELARGAYARIAGVYIVATLITMLPMSLVWGSFGFATALGTLAEPGVGTVGPTYAVSQILTYLVPALTGPFSAAVLVLLYFDRRVRVEGFGIEMPDQPVAAGAVFAEN